MPPANYWTAVLYFRAANGTYKRVPNIGNNQFEKANGGLTIYYMQDAIYDENQKSNVTAFKPVCLTGILFSVKTNLGRAFACSSETCMPGRWPKLPDLDI